MLKKQYPLIGGLQSTGLSQKFAMEPQGGEFVQVLNINESHWITISTIGCEQGAINVYDSLHWHLPQHAQRVVADLMQCSDKAVKVNYTDVQWQSGASDCGLFALAFAATLCSAQDPTTLLFSQQEMRSHLLGCIEAGVLTSFPVRGKRRQIKPPRVKLIAVFCVCRLIDDGTRMVQCSTCDEWFHTACTHVPDKYLANERLQWNCQDCV